MRLFRVAVKTSTKESLEWNKQNYFWLLIESETLPEINMIELEDVNLSHQKGKIYYLLPESDIE